MSKQAFLIMVHNQPLLLQKLITLIDDERNDIFIHIDKKINQNLFTNIQVFKSNLYFVPQVKVAWGDISFIKAEISLFKTAYNTDNYSYFHLISGVDLPLKTPDQFHSFFDNNSEIEYLGFDNFDASRKEVSLRMNYYHLLTKYGKNYNKLKRYSASLIRKSFVKLQKIIHFSRTQKQTFYMGTNWCSVTASFVKYLLSKENEIYKTYSKSICVDELYKQTLAYNSEFKDKINKCENQFDQCLREIDWKRGNPYTYKLEDFEILKNSNNFFARKFSEENIEIVNKLSAYLMEL